MAVISRVTFSATLLGLSFAAGLAFAEGPAPASAAEDAFLDILPRVEVPDMVELIPGSVNEEFRHCEAFWPSEYVQTQSGPEARAYRDIYGFVKARNVIMTKDCSCLGKVANWSDVESIAVDLRRSSGTKLLGWQDTKPVFEASNELFPVAQAMCGGSF